MAAVEPGSSASGFSRWGLVGLLLSTGLISLGFLPSPSDWSLFGDSPLYNWLSVLFVALAAIAQMSAIFPFALAIVLAGGIRLPVALVRTFTCLALLIGALSLLTSGLADVGGDILRLHVVLMTLAVVGMLLFASRRKPGAVGRHFRFLAILVPTVGALWSLITIPIVLVSVEDIAAGRPFCLARLSGGGLAQAKSIAELRWFSFYTTAEFTPHGQLTIADPGGARSFYRWLPWQLAFQAEREDLSSYAVWDACSPSHSFW